MDDGNNGCRRGFLFTCFKRLNTSSQRPSKTITGTDRRSSIPGIVSPSRRSPFAFRISGGRRSKSPPSFPSRKKSSHGDTAAIEAILHNLQPDVKPFDPAEAWKDGLVYHAGSELSGGQREAAPRLNMLGKFRRLPAKVKEEAANHADAVFEL